VPDLEDPFFAAIARSVNRLAIRHGMSTQVTSLGDENLSEAEIVGRLLSQSLSGLIITPVATDHSYLDPWKERLPIVFVDRPPVRLTADSITEDDLGGARMATEHLIGHGHRRIAFIGDTVELPTAHARLLGYRSALEAHGIPENDDYEAFGATNRETAGAAVRKLVELPQPPTAIMSANARSTMSLVPALRDHPLALVGFGDFPMADMLVPPITVIDQDPAALGTLAAQRVFDRLAHPSRRFRRRTQLPVALIERSSCVPIP
jgi:LacI family transcriptional regulator